MSTFDRSSGPVKCADSVKFIKGFKSRIALPVLLLSLVTVGLIFWFFEQIPSENNWVIFRDYDEWRPQTEVDYTNEVNLQRFAFVRPIESALTPKSVRFDSPLGSEHGAMVYNAQSFMMANSRLGSNHLADDLNGIGGMNTDLGDSVYAISSGRVIYAADAGEGWGNIVIIEHAIGDGQAREYFQSVYAHLNDFFVIVGSIVQRGEIIGEVGNANGKYPAHLHFEIRKSNVVDPGRGYSRKPLNRLNPTQTIKEWRGAEDDTLNVAPIFEEGEKKPNTLTFDF